MNFYERALHELSAAAAPGVRGELESVLIEAYRSSRAHDITDTEDVHTEWDELGAMLSSDHGLRDIALGELRSKIHAALKDLTYSDSLALWVAYGSAFDFLDGREPDEYDGIQQDSNGVSEVIEHICLRMLDTAVIDWGARPPKRVKADDEAYLQSLIDGTADTMAPDIFDRLEPMFTAYEGDPDMMALLNRAGEVYSEAAIKAAKEALASM